MTGFLAWYNQAPESRGLCMVDDFPHEVAQVFDLAEHGPLTKYGAVHLAEGVPDASGFGTVSYTITPHDGYVSLNSWFSIAHERAIQLSYELYLLPDGRLGHHVSTYRCAEYRSIALDFFAHLPTDR